MRRLLGIAVVGLAVLGSVVLGVAASGGGSGYEVRAIFDNVASAVPGEDVKVAGAKVGVIESMDVTPDKRAAVVLRIDDARFTPFRGDAKCTVRPQSLIGEKFVECEPGTSGSPTLRKIDRGQGQGQHLLPLAQTSSPVDLDLVNDVMRLPYRERFAILLNEFGTGLAGRGADLNEVIHRANPALRQTDRVLKILAGQNRVLAQLATDSDTVLQPLARDKRRVSDFIVQANATAQATAERRGALRASIRRLPGFLRQLRPLMADLGSFSDQATPVVRDLGTAAPDVSRLVRQLGPFSAAARPAIRSLGQATVKGRPALLRARPLVQDLRRFAREARPVSVNLDDLTKSLDKTGGIERLMDYLFFQMTAINGFDSIGHYLRAGLIVNLCSTYATSQTAGCPSNFTSAAGSSASVKPRLAASPKAGGAGGSVAPQGSVLGALLGNESPGVQRQRARKIADIRRQAAQPSPGLRGGRDQVLLDYLLRPER
jgi:phospholipid/cholesterol/gamma-HCH transport system substrate-binding protein